MKYEQLPDGLAVPKIGFGTWSIGGRSLPDLSMDERSLDAFHSALELGYTHFDTAEGYAAGHCEELLGQAIRESDVAREKLFITTKVSPEHLHHADVLDACEASLRRLKIDYIDLYLIHWPNHGIQLADTFQALNKLVHDGKVRHLGVSNFNLSLLKQAQAESETPLLTNQVPYRLPDRTYVKNGVLEYCQQNDILLTAYSPVKYRGMNVNKNLRKIAKAHDASPYQIALAWLVQQPRVITIPMSFNPQHQADNLAAANIELTPDEISQLDHLV
jgi:diketogulonate reductase-like aldo/keto reductase